MQICDVLVFIAVVFERRFIALTNLYTLYRAVFKWLSKVITWLQLLRLVIGLKDSRQFFNQWEAKSKPIAPCTRDFSRASSELQVIARNCDWFIVLPAPVVIGWSYCFGIDFSTVIENRSIQRLSECNVSCSWKYSGTMCIVVSRLIVID